MAHTAISLQSGERSISQRLATEGHWEYRFGYCKTLSEVKTSPCYGDIIYSDRRKS